MKKTNKKVTPKQQKKMRKRSSKRKPPEPRKTNQINHRNEPEIDRRKPNTKNKLIKDLRRGGQTPQETKETQPTRYNNRTYSKQQPQNKFTSREDIKEPRNS